MRIGDICLTHGVLLAPMAGVCDGAFRLICRENGAEMVVGEMISSRGICYGDKKTAELASISEGEYPCALQLFGNDPDFMARAAARLMEFSPSVIDINMGCPVPKIAGSGDGSALMRSPGLARDIVRAVVDAVDVPVTVKIRKGWNDEEVNAVRIALAAQESGAAAVTVHGRTRMQMYSGRADYDIIRQVKDALDIPVIANGDIDGGESALRVLEHTRCDGIMVGRGALGRPWVFAEIIAALEGRRPPEYTPSMKRDIICRHVSLAVRAKGERKAVPELRKHLSWYMKGMKNAASMRERANKASSAQEMYSIAESISEQPEING